MVICMSPRIHYELYDVEARFTHRILNPIEFVNELTGELCDALSPHFKHLFAFYLFAFYLLVNSQIRSLQIRNLLVPGVG